MAKNNIPLTKEAQKRTPYVGEIPHYVAKMERAAVKAGLTITKLTDNDRNYKWLFLYLAGTKKQVSSYSLFNYSAEHIHWPSGFRVPAQVGIKAIDPEGGRSARLHRVGDDRFVLCIQVQLPDSVEKLPGDVYKFIYRSYDRNERLVFSGPLEGLIDLGITDEDMFTENGMSIEESCGGHTYRLSESAPLEGGHWSLTQHLDSFERLEEARSAERQRDLVSYKNPAEWLDEIESFICRLGSYKLPEKGCTVDTKSGMRYHINPAHLAPIRNAIEVAAQKLRDVPVVVSQINDEATDQKRMGGVSAAQSDVAFQRFIGKLQGQNHAS